jgi:pimeloyl-ACP methyl ester carboxylesterase
MAQELASALGARLELIPQAAHLPCIEQPERLSQHIRSFLREQGHG